MSLYPNYLNPQQIKEAALQNQIERLQGELNNIHSQQQFQQQYAPVQQPQQIIQQQPQVNNGISTQIVQDFTDISINSVPMDNKGALFIKADGTEIQSKRWNADGKIETLSYKPILADKNEKAENVSSEQEKLKIGLSDDVTRVFSEMFTSISDRLSVIEQNLPVQTQTKGRTRKTEKGE